MEVNKCEKCGGVLGGLSLYPYYENILGKKTYTTKIGGQKCLECGDIRYANDEDTIEHLQKQKAIKVAESMSDEKFVPILISNIKNIRVRQKQPQKLIAKALGVSEQRVGAIERNANTPTVLTFYQIAAILGVENLKLYDLVYISKESYEKIKDMEIITVNDKPKFKVVEEVKEKRKDLFNLREEIKVINDEKRDLRTSHRKKQISEEEFKEKVKILDKKKSKLNEIKNGVDGKGGLEREIKVLESKHNLIIKQDNVIDSEYWKHLKNELEDDLKEIEI